MSSILTVAFAAALLALMFVLIGGEVLDGDTRRFDFASVYGTLSLALRDALQSAGRCAAKAALRMLARTMSKQPPARRCRNSVATRPKQRTAAGMQSDS